MQAPFKPFFGILVISFFIFSCSNLSSNPDETNHPSALSADESETPEDEDSEPSDTGDSEEPTEDGDGAFETTDADGGIVEVTEALAVVERIRLLLEEEDTEETGDEEEPEEGGEDEEGDGEGEPEDEEETPEEIDTATDESAEETEEETEEEAEVEEEDADALQVKGPYIFDLIAMTVDPALEDADFLADTYSRVDVRIHSLKKNLDDELAGLALKVVGTCTDSEQTVQNFELFVKLNEWLRYTAEGGVIINTAADVVEILKQLILVEWFQNIHLCDCLASDRGEVDGDVIIIHSPGDGGECNFTSDLKKTIKGVGQGEPTP